MTGFEPAAPATRTRCATKLRYIPIYLYFVCHSGVSFGNQRYQVLSQNNTQLFCSAECYIPIFLYFVCHSGFPLVTSATKPLTKQYLIVLFGRVLHPDLFIFSLSFGIPFGNQRYQVLSQNNTQLFCSAECYIPIYLYLVCHSGVSLVTSATRNSCRAEECYSRNCLFRSIQQMLILYKT